LIDFKRDHVEWNEEQENAAKQKVLLQSNNPMTLEDQRKSYKILFFF